MRVEHETLAARDLDAVRRRAFEIAASRLDFARDECPRLYRELSAALECVQRAGVGLHPATVDPSTEVAEAGIARLKSGVRMHQPDKTPSLVLDPPSAGALVDAYAAILRALGPDLAAGTGRDRLASALIARLDGHDATAAKAASASQAIDQFVRKCEQCLARDGGCARMCPWRE